MQYEYMGSNSLTELSSLVKRDIATKADVTDLEDYVNPDAVATAITTALTNYPDNQALQAAITEALSNYLTASQVRDEILKVADSTSVQEYDTEDGWHVRKWSTGYVEMCTTKISSATPPIYFFTGAFPFIEYPVNLKRRYSEIASAQPSEDGFLAGWVVPRGIEGQMSLSHTMEYSHYRSSPYPDVDSAKVGINISVTGRWK